MLDTVRSALDGELSIDSFVAAQLIARLRESPLAASGRVPHEPFDEADAMAQLTPRQNEVVRLVAEGMSNGEIAAQLCLSTATVKSHVRSSLRALNARDRTQLAIRARRLAPRAG